MRKTIFHDRKWVLLYPLAFLLAACSGPEGDPGRDGVVPDTEPPSISMLRPSYGDTLTHNFDVEVRAADNVGVDRVVFFLNGSAQKNDTTQANDTSAVEGIYSYSFNATDWRMDLGLHTIAARAYDENENSETTPTLLVYYYGASAQTEDSLAYFGMGNIESGTLDLPIPETSSDSLYNVRFHVPQRSALQAVHFFVDQNSTSDNVHEDPMLVRVMSSNGIFPSTTRFTESSELAPDSSRYWQEHVFEQVDTFATGERFHIGLTLDATIEDTSRTALRIALNEPYLLPVDNHSIYYDKDLDRWVTFQETGVGDDAPEIWVYAIIEYLDEEDGGSGKRGLLLPEGIGQAASKSGQGPRF